MNTQRNPFDPPTTPDCITGLRAGSPDNCSCNKNCCDEFSQWLDRELEILMDRFSGDITHNSLRNSLLRDR